MTGDKEGQMRGIIPRSVEQIIDQATHMRADGWDITVTMSMVIKYFNETTFLPKIYYAHLLSTICDMHAINIFFFSLINNLKKGGDLQRGITRSSTY
jgi:hypothetical protein